MSLRLFHRILTLCASLILLLSFSAVAHAAVGTIDPSSTGNDTAQFEDSSFGSVNFKTTNGTPVTITNSAITGEVWGDVVGWINLNPTNGGVVNTCSGDLGGYAWGENTGWINFGPTNGGVSINPSSGEFSGFAWSQNYGWLEFACPGASCVTTDWSCTSGGGSPTGGGSTIPAACSITATPAIVTSGNSTLLNWTSNLASITSGTIVSSATGNTAYPTSPSGSVYATPPLSTTYTATLTGALGTAVCSVIVLVDEVLDPMVPGEVHFVQPSYTVNEGTPMQTISVERVIGTLGAVTAVVTTHNGSAVSGSDYGTVVGTVSWADGEAGIKTVTVPIIDDLIIESVEDFSATLGSVTGGASLGLALTNVSIVDNDINPDVAGQIEFIHPVYNIGRNDGHVTIHVARVGGSLGAASVMVTSQDATAVSGSDYGYISQIITWEDGEAGIKTFNVPIYPLTGGPAAAWFATPAYAAGNPYFYLNLSDAVNATLGALTTTQVIIEEEEPLPPPEEEFECTGDFCVITEPLSMILAGLPIPPSGPLRAIALAAALLAAVANIPGIIFRLQNLFLAWLGFRKRRRDWGVVYDSVTKQPLDPAYVVLSDLQGNEVASSITDLDGRYGFLVPPGIYRINAGKTHYQFPSRMLAGKQKDELYDNLYFGGEIEIKRDDEVITKNIPMDPLDADWNEIAKRQQRRFGFFKKADIVFHKIVNFFFWAGFALAVFMVVIAPETINFLILGLYVFMLILSLSGWSGRKYGKVSDRSGNPLAFAIIRVFNPELHREVAHKVTNANGRYYSIVPKGRYYITIERKNPDGSYEKVYTSQIMRVKNGILKDDFKTL